MVLLYGSTQDSLMIRQDSYIYAQYRRKHVIASEMVNVNDEILAQNLIYDRGKAETYFEPS